VHIQYQTNDTWADVRQSDNTRKDWEDAFTAVTYMEQIYDDPTQILDQIAPNRMQIQKVGNSAKRAQY
jgi:hypothetical protein